MKWKLKNNNMKLYLRALLYKHLFLRWLGLRQGDVIKIWFDRELNMTLLYTSCRSGVYYLPNAEPGKYSYWLASYAAQEKYPLHKKKKDSNIYYLIDISGPPNHYSKKKSNEVETTI